MKIIPKYMYLHKTITDSDGNKTRKNLEIPNNPLSLKTALNRLKIDYEARWDKTPCQKTRNRYSKVIMRINASLERGYIPKNSTLWTMIRKNQLVPKVYKTEGIRLGDNFEIPVLKSTYKFLASKGSIKTGLIYANIINPNVSKEIKGYIEY